MRSVLSLAIATAIVRCISTGSEGSWCAADSVFEVLVRLLDSREDRGTEDEPRQRAAGEDKCDYKETLGHGLLTVE